MRWQGGLLMLTPAQSRSGVAPEAHHVAHDFRKIVWAIQPAHGQYIELVQLPTKTKRILEFFLSEGAIGTW